MRSANSIARRLLVLGAFVVASCHKDVTTVSNVSLISVVPSTVSLLVGDTLTVKASASDATGLALTGIAFTYKSADTSIAIVSATGTITAKKLGLVVITTLSGTATASTTVTVVAALPPSISSITVSPAPAFVVVHGTQQLGAVVRDANGAVIPNLSVTWQSNNPPVATVSSTGLVTGVSLGAAIVTANIAGYLGQSTVTVSASIVLGPSTVAVSPAVATIGVGRTAQFTATATDSTGNTFPNTSAVWKSSNVAVVKVDANGLATGLTAGTATISGTAFGGTGNATVTVTVLNFVAVSAGDLHSCGLTANGSPWCWGGDQADQLGDSTQTNSVQPVLVLGGLHFAQLSSGYAHNCGLTAASTAFCWGDNVSGELGDGTTNHRSSPVAVAGGKLFTSISSGQDHTCGLTAAGAAWCWGNNTSGQLGNNSTANSSAPVAVNGGLAFATISAGFQMTCGVATNGAAWCWGDNSRGELGNGTFNSSSVPVAITAGSTTFVSVGAGFLHACGVTVAGAAVCWGSNDQGQLGTGDTQSHATPTAVSGGVTFATVSVGGLYTCGLAASGAAYCWGDNIWGQGGSGATSPSNPVPTIVAGGLTFRTLSTGNYHACVLAGGNVAYCWGDNGQGQLGSGTVNLSAAPVKVIFQP